MQKLSSTIEKLFLNATKALKFKKSRNRLEKDFPLIFVYGGLEYRRGLTCEVDYVESKEDRIARLKREEAQNKYYDSPEFAVIYFKMKGDNRSETSLDEIKNEL
jgi:hypothetical protein